MSNTIANPVNINLDPERALFGGALNGMVALCYANEKPFQGLAGLLDWRFQGELSRFVRSGAISGLPGECVYIPIRRQDRTYHILLAGAGFTETPGLRQDIPQETIETLDRNLHSLGLEQLGISSSDFGGASKEFFDQNIRGASLCVVH